MRPKFIILFFIILVGYAIVLTTLPYVSVYYTYFAIPALAATALFGYGSIRKPRSTAGIIFIITLIAWLVTLLTVSYIGVYLSIIVLPILGFSVFVFFMNTESDKKRNADYIWYLNNDTVVEPNALTEYVQPALFMSHQK